MNSVVHSEIAAVPAERLEKERELFSDLPSLRAQIGKLVTRKVDKLSCVRFGSARYSVPNDYIGCTVELRIKDGVIKVVFLGEIVAEHLVVSPGETSINDDHYGGPRPSPQRSVRPKSRAEKSFYSLGPAADAFIKGSGSPGDDRLGPGSGGAVASGGHPRPSAGDRRTGAGRRSEGWGLLVAKSGD